MQLNTSASWYSYAYSVSGGSITSIANTVNWTLPDSVGTYHLYAYVMGPGKVGAVDSLRVDVKNGPPKAASLSIDSVTATKCYLSWTKSKEFDFKSYNVYYSENSYVDSNDTKILTSSTQSDTDYTVIGLDENTRYSFVVYIKDVNGNTTGSQYRSATTLNAVPDAVTLLTAEAVSADIAMVCWHSSQEKDFRYYRLYYGTNSNVDSSSTLAGTVSSKNDTDYIVNGLIENTQYWFAVYVVDDDRLVSKKSNTKYTTTGNAPPPAVYQNTPSTKTSSSIQINWRATTISDFSSYSVYYSTLSLVTDQSTLAGTVTGVNTTSFTITNLDENTRYYFTIYIKDRHGLTTGGNIRYATTLNAAPDAITLLIPDSVTADKATIHWRGSQEKDFNCYRLYYATSSDVDSSSTLARRITSKNDTDYTVNGLSENTQYWFAVYVRDDYGLFSEKSNVKKITTGNAAPPAVVQKPPLAKTSSSIQVNWAAASIADFASYSVYYSTSSEVSDQSTFVGTVSDLGTTSLTVTNLDENTRYYFIVYIKDSGGMTTGSNKRYATTLNAAPDAVTLLTPEAVVADNVTIRWRASQEKDFSHYRLYYSTSLNVDSSSTLAGTISSKNDTTLIVNRLNENTHYWFAVYVKDRYSSFSEKSNIRKITTGNAAPTAVSQTGPTEITSNSIRINWSEGSISDFAHYAVYYSTSSGVSDQATLAGTISDIGTTSIVVTNLAATTRYYFIVYINDNGGMSTGSNIRNATTQNASTGIP